MSAVKKMKAVTMFKESMPLLLGRARLARPSVRLSWLNRLLKASIYRKSYQTRVSRSRRLVRRTSSENLLRSQAIRWKKFLKTSLKRNQMVQTCSWIMIFKRHRKMSYLKTLTWDPPANPIWSARLLMQRFLLYHKASKSRSLRLRKSMIRTVSRSHSHPFSHHMHNFVQQPNKNPKASKVKGSAPPIGLSLPNRIAQAVKVLKLDASSRSMTSLNLNFSWWSAKWKFNLTESNWRERRG